MRICSPQLGLAPNSILGGEVFDREILLGLVKKGVNVEIILPKNKPHDTNIKKWRITTLAISRFPAILANIIFLPYLTNIYRKKPFKILRIHQPQFVGLGCLFFKIFFRKVRLVATFHQFRETNFWLVSKLINNLWDHIFCDSNYVKRLICQKYQVSESKITVVHNGVPTYLAPMLKDNVLLKKMRLEGKIVLLFMGLFIERKNPIFMMDVFANLYKMNKNLALIFWGDGPMRAKILQRAEDLGVFDNVRIQKPMFGRGKNKIHNLADIFVHPSVDEGFALSPLEAMACAKPVVISRGYSSAEAVDDNTNGYLCIQNDLDDWNNKLSLLIKNPDLREKMGKASLEKVKREFQWRLSVRKHFDIYNNL